jgi:hypothetical protein
MGNNVLLALLVQTQLQQITPSDWRCWLQEQELIMSHMT